MASVSLDVARGQQNQEAYFHVGTAAPAHGDIQLSVDLTKGWTTQEVADFLDAAKRRILDGFYNDIHNV